MGENESGTRGVGFLFQIEWPLSEESSERGHKGAEGGSHAATRQENIPASE